MAKISRPATRIRKAVSHHGERAGDFWAGTRSSNSRKGGNRMVCGRGGVTRSNSHNSGKAKAASNSSGCSTASEDTTDMG